jgi:hypothetical protein
LTFTRVVSCAAATATLYAGAVLARICLKPSDVPDRLDPIRKCLHERLQEFAGAVADEIAVFIEELVGMADIGFRLLHGRHVQKHQDCLR